MVAQQRLASFTAIIPRFQSLRRLGVNSKQMVRAAGPPAILYGCDTMGVSNSALHTMRTRVAAAAAPGAGGKSPDMVLHIIDGPNGTIDPAFEAHSGPLRMWAFAWWEGWFQSEVLCKAFGEASLKVGGTEGSWWHRTAGPAAAVIASLRRLGWTMPSAQEAVDDLGTSWWFLYDPPAAVVRACHASVRRWRLARVGESMPGLIPVDCDIAPTHRGQVQRLIDFSYLLAPLVNARGSGSRISQEWDPKWKGHLASACCGGQWPQARKAQVPQWDIEDVRCQLCFSATGTLEHRLRCPATTPAAGWPAPPRKASKMLCKLSEVRLRLLNTRGMLVLRVPTEAPKLRGEFLWIKRPDFNHPELEEAIWYFDGSMLNGKWAPLRATGFGVAVVSKRGQLLGFGRGTPPHWCSTAAAAEAWALQEVLAMLPFPPHMRTDCQALLATLESGTGASGAANKPLARIWKYIANILGGCFRPMVEDDKLVWMPAHTSTGAVGEAKLSNGTRLSMLDWRANRLVDALAKMSALEAQYLPEAVELLRSAEVAVTHAAKLLGRTTHAANSHSIVVENADGMQVTKITRDAMQIVHKPKRRLSPDKLASLPKCSKSAPSPPNADGDSVLPPPLKAPRVGVTSSSASSRARARERERLRQRVDEIGLSLSVPELSARDRMAALRQRVGIAPSLPPE